MSTINKIAYPDTTLRFIFKNDNLYVSIPDEFEREYQIYISNDGYLMIDR